ncbi:S-adenosyl-L-methionine-dependent methyltransferase [Camillea tinctor]|nr:S-adenosyl-L-methionine-dependent methyltransferase [Camillea tinctor]
MSAKMDPTLFGLLQLGALVQSSITKYLEYHEVKEGSLPAKPGFDAQRTLLAAAGGLTELTSDPSSRLLEVAMQYYEARALHLVADLRVADILKEGGESGVSLETLASKCGIEPRKFGRIMRCLCSIHIFKEVAPDYYANNRISEALVDNEPLRSYILMFGLDLYSASDYLPRTLTDPVKGPSYKVDCTPWQDAVNTKKPRWEWLEENPKVEHIKSGLNGTDGAPSAYPGPFGNVLKTSIEGKSTGQEIRRPEHKIFGLAMLGGGKVFGQAHLYDFPWASLGKATVVDVGGGVGGFCLQLSHIYPELNFVVQDRAPVLKQAESEVWPQENRSALDAGRVKFVPHSFFDVNPTKGADVYWLRYIIHDWSDDYCVQILSAIKPSMGPRSRILICDQVMNTTLGCEELPPAPSPLPANWGYYTRYSHQRDLAMMAIINGIERKPVEFRALAEAAGLKLRNLYDCRSQVGLVELVLPDSTL